MGGSPPIPKSGPQVVYLEPPGWVLLPPPTGTSLEARKYIRHPSNIPLVLEVVGHRPEFSCQGLKNISAGGLCCRYEAALEPGAEVRIRIELVDPVFEAEGQVVWCLTRPSQRPKRYPFEVGIQFTGPEERHRLRMVEQICHIESYRREVLVTEGRVLDAEEAAAEWILGNAKDFPHP
ncbi:MAG: PilZ domain-containing protein [Planctomycetota bacterium]|nr:MAG: PilZ domain-containing protein [Planctomycetota bacterium]